ncbi:MAG: restriction endonuclease subunit S [Rhodocyclaceae bacterium]
MAGKWPYKRVEEIALKIAMGPFGSSIKVETFTDSGIPIISGQHLREAQVTDGEFNFIKEAHADSLKNANVQRGDVIFTHAGNIGQVAFIPDDSAYQRYVISQRQFYLRCNTDLMLPEFITYYFKTPEGQHRLLANANQVGVPSIARPSSYLKTIEVPAPSIEEQQVVVRNIKALDAKIRLNIGINQTIDAMARAIFKSWFVDFDPVQAKIAAIVEGRDPLRAAMSAISGKPDAELDTLPPEQYEQLAATAALFPDEMEDSESGDIPKGWACGALGDICGFTAGSAFKPEHQGSTEGEFPFIKVSDMNLAGNEVFIQSANNYVSKSQQSEMKAKLHPSGATVFAKIGVALISNRRRLLTTPTIIDNNLMSASPVEGKSGQYFLYSLLSTLDFNTLVSGTALPYINVSDLKKIPIVRPPYDACHAFEAKASSMFSMMQTLAAQSSTLATTRDALLPKLLLGEIEASGIFEG